MKRIITICVAAVAAVTVAVSCGNTTPSGDMTAVYTPAAGGLSGGSNVGSANLSIRTDCGTGSGVAWDGDSWECSSLGTSYTAGDGLTLTLNDFDVNVGAGVIINGSDQVALRNDCADGQLLKSGGTGTTWTCAADNDSGGDVIAITTTAPLGVGGTPGATCSSGSCALTERAYGGGSTTGYVPTGGSSSTFLRGDGTWVTPTDTNTTYTAGPGLQLIGTQFNLNQSCNVGELLKWNGTIWTCSTDTNTLGPDGDKGDVTVGGTGTTLTVDNSTITSAKLNITTTSCSAGNHVSAISAGGVGTCTADAGGISGLTTGIIPTATSATTVGNGRITDDGTNPITLGLFTEAFATGSVTAGVQTAGASTFAVRNTTNNVEAYMVAGGSGVDFGSSTNHSVNIRVNTVAKLTVASDAMDSNGTYAGFGTTDYAYYIDATNTRPGTGCLYTTNGTATCYINPVGYQAGTTQTRSLEIDDGTGTGAGNRIAFFDGTDLSSELFGTLDVTGLVTATAGVTTPANLTTTGSGALSVAGNATAGDADSDFLNARGTLAVSGTDVTISSCGTSPTVTGEAQSFQLNPGTGTSCVINLNRTFNSAPYCTFSAASTEAAACIGSGGVDCASGGANPFVTATTTQVTFTFATTVKSGTDPIYNVSCVDRR